MDGLLASIFGGFWLVLGGKLAPKPMPKSMLSSKGGFLKKPCFSLGKTYFFEIQGVEVESKNRSKIDVKNDAETERLGNFMFIDS